MSHRGENAAADTLQVWDGTRWVSLNNLTLTESGSDVTATATGILTLAQGASSGIVVTTGAGSYALPPADGTAGQVLTTDGAGVTSWTTVSGGGIQFRQTFAWVTGSGPVNILVDLSALGLTDEQLMIEANYSVQEAGFGNQCWYWARGGARFSGGIWEPTPNFFPTSGSYSSGGFPSPAALLQGLGSATSLRFDAGVDPSFPSGAGELVLNIIAMPGTP
jgi:hypothetical protein